jgi:hypothetical protein
MKNKVLIKALLLLSILSISLISYSQDKSKNRLLVVWTNSVIPSQAEQYQNAVKKQAALMKKYNHATPYYVYSTEDYYYYWVTFIDNFAAFDDLSSQWFKFKSEAEINDGFIHDQEFKGTTNYILPEILTTRSELSYVPAGQTFKPEDLPYFRFGYCYAKRGVEKEFEDNWKLWVALFTKYDIPIGWTMYEGILGTETPFYIWGETYRNELDMATSRAKAYEKMGEEPTKLWQETERFLRKIEYKTGWYRPDLSYVPEN